MISIYISELDWGSLLNKGYTTFFNLYKKDRLYFNIATMNYVLLRHEATNE